MALVASIGIVLCFATLAGFTGYWAWLFYNQLVAGKDPVSVPFMLREVAYAMMFTSYTVLILLGLFGYEVTEAVELAGGLGPTLVVVGSYFLLHRELNRQKRRK